MGDVFQQGIAKYLLSMGISVIIGIKAGDSDARRNAIEEGCEVADLFEAVERADVVQVC